MSRPLAVDRMCEMIEEAGIEYVFGIQGGITYRLFNALGRRGKVKLVIARHEQAAALMAAAYGRLTGKPAIVMGQGPFIASSAAFGILEAYMGGYPMIVISDAVTNAFGQKGMIQSGTGEYGSFDLTGVLRTMTKATYLATTAKQAMQGLQLAIKQAVTGRKGPAGLVIYQPEVYETYEPETPPYLYDLKGYLPETQTLPAPETLKQAAERIASAKSPVIVAGNGVHMANAYDELRQLAERLGAPVATTYKGKSAISEYHPLALGMMGDYGQLAANQAVGDADVVLVLGSKLGASDTSQENPALVDPNRQTLIQLDIDPHRAGWALPCHLALIGDLKPTLSALLEQLHPVEQDMLQQRQAAVQRLKAESGYHDMKEMHIDATPIYPQRVLGILNDEMPEDTMLMMDAGSNRSWTAHLFKAKSAGSVLAPGGIAGMGSSVPAAVAAKLVNPERPVVCVIGDGGFAMTSNAISTAVQYDAPIIAVVMNDSRLGMPAARQGNDRISTDFIDTNFAEIARGYGANGVRTDSPEGLRQAIRDALRADRATVIDVLIDTEQKYTMIQPFTEEMRRYKKTESNPYTENAFF